MSIKDDIHGAKVYIGTLNTREQLHLRMDDE